MVTEALLAARAGATAMHDPTEGSVAAALFELATASGRRLVADLDRIAVHPHPPDSALTSGFARSG